MLTEEDKTKETQRNTVLNSTKFTNFNAVTNRSGTQMSDQTQS